MNKLVIAVILVCSLIQSDTPRFEAFIKTFEKSNTTGIIEFARLAETGTEIRVKEALDFIYHGDSSALFCMQRSFDMETEKAGEPFKSLYLPRRIFRIELSTATVLCYETYRCENNHFVVYGEIELELVDKHFKRSQRLAVQRASDFDSDLVGLFNPQNGRIFLLSRDPTEPKYKVAKLLKLDVKSLSFKQELTAGQLTCNIDRPTKVLKLLSWDEKFSSVE